MVSHSEMDIVDSADIHGFQLETFKQPIWPITQKFLVKTF